MTNKVQFNFKSYCPFLDDYHTIEITSAEIMMSGYECPDYKKLQFKCNFSNECSKKLEECPVYSTAPHSI